MSNRVDSGKGDKRRAENIKKINENWDYIKWNGKKKPIRGRKKDCITLDDNYIED